MAASTRKISAIDFDRVLQHVGPFGPWQYFHVFLLFLVTLSSGLSVVTFAFTGTIPRHRCVIPRCETIENSTYEFKTERDDFIITKDVEKQIYKSCQRINMN